MSIALRGSDDKFQVCNAYYTKGFHQGRTEEENLEFLNLLFCKIDRLTPFLSFMNRDLITDGALPFLADLLKLTGPHDNINLRNTSITDAGIRKYRHLFSPSCQLWLDECYGITPLSAELDQKLNVSTSFCGSKYAKKNDATDELYDNLTFRTLEIYEKYGPHPEMLKCRKVIAKDTFRHDIMPFVCKIEWHREPQRYKVRSINA